jgi:hypothetical protein
MKKKEFENFFNSIHTRSGESTLTISELYCILRIINPNFKLNLLLIRYSYRILLLDSRQLFLHGTVHPRYLSYTTIDE